MFPSMTERTLVIVKPEHFGLTDLLVEELAQHGTVVERAAVLAVHRDVVAEHYAVHRERPMIYERLVRQFEARPVAVVVYEGDSVIQKIRDAIGPTEPVQGLQHQLRRRWSDDTYEKAAAEDRALRNVVHASDSRESYEREYSVWEKFLCYPVFSLHPIRSFNVLHLSTKK